MSHRPHSSSAVFDLRRRSLLRANLLVVLSFLAAVKMSGFPQSRATLWLTVPAVLAVLGMAETMRCMRQRWNLYHGGVVLCLYMDVMAISMILFFLVSPYLL
ncbi:MAG: permease [Acidobacteriota bacterium]|nr:permease [Acidobacteriota bacterium]